MKIPRFVIAGTNSGCGKTTLTIGIIAALKKRGLNIMPFKVGPDYIDPMFHSYISGNDSRNLDSWMLGREMVEYLFCKNSQGGDIAVVEGVMGLYDGYGGYSDEGSTGHVAKIIKAPVILVVNGEGMSQSIAALLKGYMEFDRDVNICGVIVNNISSENHFELLKDIIIERLGISVIGYLPMKEEYSFPSRHLGLVPEGELTSVKDKINRLVQQVEETIDIDMLLKLADDAQALYTSSLDFNIARRNTGFKIGIARDKAFNFYYKDNLDLLELMGANLEYFSPLNDKKLPDDLDGLYFGGGFPEVWAGELSENIELKEEIKRKIESNIPAYGECGGLMYLSKSIKAQDGKEYEMVGTISGKSEITSSLQRFGYVEIDVVGDNVISKNGYRIKAHEFHYSITNVDWDVNSCFKVLKKRNNRETKTWNCGYKFKNLIAGYPHIHFWSNTGFAERFVLNCIQHKIIK